MLVLENSRFAVSVMPFELKLKLLTWPEPLFFSMSVVIAGMKTEAVVFWLILIPACLGNDVGNMSF